MKRIDKASETYTGRIKNDKGYRGIRERESIKVYTTIDQLDLEWSAMKQDYPSPDVLS